MQGSDHNLRLIEGILSFLIRKCLHVIEVFFKKEKKVFLITAGYTCSLKILDNTEQ